MLNRLEVDVDMVLGCLPPFVVERGMRLNENKIAYADLHKTGSIEANCARDRLLLRKQKSVAVPRGARSGAATHETNRSRCSTA